MAEVNVISQGAGHTRGVAESAFASPDLLAHDRSPAHGHAFSGWRSEPLPTQHKTILWIHHLSCQFESSLCEYTL